MLRRGSIALQSLLSLYIAVSLLGLLASLMSATYAMDFDYHELSNEVALRQLRRIMTIGYDLDVYDESLRFIYHGDEYELYFTNGHLILTPGTQIFLEGVDFEGFSEEGEMVYLNYEYEGKRYRRPLCRKFGLCIADFPADHDTADELSAIPE